MADSPAQGGPALAFPAEAPQVPPGQKDPYRWLLPQRQGADAPNARNPVVQTLRPGVHSCGRHQLCQGARRLSGAQQGAPRNQGVPDVPKITSELNFN